MHYKIEFSEKSSKKFSFITDYKIIKGVTIIITESDKQYLKAQLQSYLEDTGRVVKRNKPFRCVKRGHEDVHPSMQFNDKTNTVTCFSCGFQGDIFDVAGEIENLSSVREQMDSVAKKYGINTEAEPIKKSTNEVPFNNPDKIKNYLKIAINNYNASTYLLDRGISEEVQKAFGIGYLKKYLTTDGNEKGKYITWEEVALIPTSEESFVVRNTDKNADKNNRLRKKGSIHFLNADVIDKENIIYVVEGEIDALSLLTIGIPAIALGSVKYINKFNEMVKEKPKNKERCFILCLDQDVEGKKAADDLQVLLEKIGENSFIYSVSGSWKDPNEALQKNKEELISLCKEGMIRAEEYVLEKLQEKEKEENQEKINYIKTNNTASYIDAFTNGIKDSVDTKAISTGFSKLDSALGDGFFEGLYVVGAISSLGKTTFALQMADKIASEGNDVLIFSLEMARTELMAKSISRLSFELIDNASKYGLLAKGTRGITNGKKWTGYRDEEREHLKKAIETYGKYAERIFIVEGVGNITTEKIREAVDKHVRITGNKPIVFIDYLQIISPAEIRSTDKQNADRAVIELKRISRDYKIPVIVISSFSRNFYNTEASMESFKESGGIEYSSDVLLGMQYEGVNVKGFDGDEAARKDPRRIEIKVLKNRNGRKGDVLGYEFYPVFNYYKER